MNKSSIITHLQIIRTWAEFAIERDLQFFTAKHLEDIALWTDDAISLIKEQDSCENCAIAIEDRQHVIHCKDCKHGVRLDNSNYYVCSKPFASNRETHTEDWFCADGRR